MKKEKCTHKNVEYFPSLDEDGWRCRDCQQKLGFRPDLDRYEIENKVMGLLIDINEQHLIHVSSATGGRYIAEKIAKKCIKENWYDQYSIILLIMRYITSNHGNFWKKEAEKWLKKKKTT